MEHLTEYEMILYLASPATAIEHLIVFFRGKGVLKTHMNCDHCGTPMREKNEKNTKKYPDEFYWRCYNDACPKRFFFMAG